MLLTLLSCFALAYLAALISGQTPALWRRMPRVSRTRRNLRRARVLNAKLAEMAARDSDELREKILDGAYVIALLDASNADQECEAAA